MRTTNGIQHDIKLFQKVWHLDYGMRTTFVVEKFTEKRVMCREIHPSGKRQRLTGFCPSKLFDA